jgi:hypothetical protein
LSARSTDFSDTKGEFVTQMLEVIEPGYVEFSVNEALALDKTKTGLTKLLNLVQILFKLIKHDFFPETWWKTRIAKG